MEDADRQPAGAWGESGVSSGFSAAWWNLEMCHAGALLPWSQESVLVLGQLGGLRIHRVLRDGRLDADFGSANSVQSAPEGFQYVFGMTPDDLGGLWVFFRQHSERGLGAVHVPGRR